MKLQTYFKSKAGKEAHIDRVYSNVEARYLWKVKETGTERVSHRAAVNDVRAYLRGETVVQTKSVFNPEAERSVACSTFFERFEAKQKGLQL